MANGATYRQMRPEDEDAVFDLWLSTWGEADRAVEQRVLHTDPDYLSRTHIAVGEDGQVLSTAHYWVREMCDAAGTPRRVGCLRLCCRWKWSHAWLATSPASVSVM